MTEIINKIVKNSVWIGAQILVSVPEEGYVDMKLRNGYFCVVQCKNPYEVRVYVSAMGGLNSLISTNNVCELLEKLSH